jgi:hypothetical protein
MQTAREARGTGRKHCIFVLPKRKGYKRKTPSLSHNTVKKKTEKQIAKRTKQKTKIERVQKKTPTQKMIATL